MKKRFLLGLLVCLLAFSFVFVTCDNGNDGGSGTITDNTVTYVSTDEESNEYELIISKDPLRAAYTPVIDDFYRLIITLITGVTKISNGTISAFENGILTLQPNYEGSGEFKVTISGGKMTAMDGTIALEGGGSTKAPEGTLAPGGGGGGGGTNTSVVGTWECWMTRKEFAEAAETDEAILIVFGVPERFKFLELVLNAGDTYTMYEIDFKTNTMEEDETGTYTVDGNKVTCTSSDGEENPPFTHSGNQLTGTFPNSESGKLVTITFTKK